jgi:hypothetical protein
MIPLLTNNRVEMGYGEFGLGLALQREIILEINAGETVTMLQGCTHYIRSSIPPLPAIVLEETVYISRLKQICQGCLLTSANEYVYYALG